MKGSFWGLLIATICVGIIALITGGWTLVGEGFSATRTTFFQALPLLIVAFLVTGQVQVLLSRKLIDRLWGRLSGLKGILFSSVAGGLFPGPPYVYYPFFASFKEREIPSHFFFSFVVGKQIYDFTRFPMEVSLINPGIALLRNLITLPFPFLMGIFFRRFVSREAIVNFIGKGGK